jgi:hypothetical protein
MKKKYLLYIDILGFADLVLHRPEEVRRVYQIIEGLNCHKHDAFRVIVFSDTLLIYNIDDPFLDHDHSYIVMFMIEFTQNLLYSFAGKGFFFRSVLVNGEFEHTSPSNIERFFGSGLVRAYLSEKSIPCTGLFIHTDCQKYNDIFPVEPFNEEFSFVYLNQSLDRLMSGELGDLPVKGYWLEQTDSQWQLAKDIRFLSDVHSLMRSHIDPRVRQKFLMTWDFYRRRYEKLTRLLEENRFDPQCISTDFDWREANKRMRDNYRGHNIEPPTIDELSEILEEARKAGAKAAKGECKIRLGDENPPSNRYFFPCGGARIVLDVSATSRLGRFLLKNANTLKRIRIGKDYRKRGLEIGIYDMHDRQEMAIDEAAAHAALDILRHRFGVDGFVETYVD